MAGTFLQAPVSSFSAEAIALDIKLIGVEGGRQRRPKGRKRRRVMSTLPALCDALIAACFFLVLKSLLHVIGTVSPQGLPQLSLLGE